jgi:DNA-binding XRE family transcriptional regulator
MNEYNLASEENGNVTIDDLIAEFIRTPEQRQNLLRGEWITRVMLQLVSARVEAGLTQSELGARMGKQQSAIARLERGDDLKLSTLFDYLAALDLTPTGRIPLGSYSEAVRRIPGAEEAAEVPDDPATSMLAAD